MLGVIAASVDENTERIGHHQKTDHLLLTRRLDFVVLNKGDPQITGGERQY